MPMSSKHLLSLLMLVSAVLFTGCFKANQKTLQDLQLGQDSSANFKVAGRVRGESAPSVRVQSVWRYPLARVFTFTICLKNRITDDNLYNQNFVATDGETEYPLVNKEDQCPTWQEEIPYNYYADAKYLEIHRTIRGKGVYQGSVQVRLLINPWTKDRALSGKEVYDLDYPSDISKDIAPVTSNLTQALQGLDPVSGERAERRLFVDEVQIDSTAKEINKIGTTFDSTLTFQPKILTYDVSGNELYVPIPHGRFRAQVYFVDSQRINGKEKANAFARTAPADADETVDLVNGVFTKTFRGVRIDQLCTLGEIELGIEIIPVGADHSLKNFQGVYLLGQCGRLISSSKVRLRDYVTKDWRNFDFKKWVTDAKALSVNERTSFHKALGSEFTLDETRARFIGVKPCETATERTIRFRYTICVRSSIMNTPVEGVNFKLSRLNEDGSLTPLRSGIEEGTDIARTDLPGGCFNWVDELTHQYYAPEQYFLRTIQLEQPESGAITRIKLAINPWDWGWTLGQDITDPSNQASVEAINKEQRLPSKFMLYGLRYETTAFRYTIDDFLNLLVKKTVLLRLDPRVLRYSSLVEGRQKNEPLRDGIYLMKFAIQKEYPDIYGQQTEYIDAVKKPVKVQAGVIVTPLEISMRDLRLMRIRSNVLVELQPLDETKLRKSCDPGGPTNYNEVKDYDSLALDPTVTGLLPRTFIGPIIPLSNYFGASMRPTDNLEELACDTPYCDQVNWNEPLASEGEGTDTNETARFFEAARKLANVSVSQLIDRKKVLDDKYKTEMTERSSPGNFAYTSNREYLQLGNEQNLKTRFPESLPIEKVNSVLSTNNQLSDFVAKLNSPVLARNGVQLVYPSPKSPSYGVLPFLGSLLDHHEPLPHVKEDEVKDLVLNNQMSQGLAHRLCYFWFNNFIPGSLNLLSDQSSRDQVYGNPRNFDIIIQACVRNVEESGPTEVFAIENKLKVGRVSDQKYLRGMSLNYQVNADLKFNRADDWKYSEGISTRPFQIISRPFRDIFGFDFTYSWNRGEQLSISEGRQSSASTYLVLQMSKFSVAFDNYERCITLGLSPRYLKEKAILLRLSQNLRPVDVLNFATRGMFICTGEPVIGYPVKYRENYYYVGQNFTDGDFHDQGDIRNHPWLLGIRGYGEFVRFLRAMENLKIVDQISELKDRFGKDVDAVVGTVSDGKRLSDEASNRRDELRYYFGDQYHAGGNDFDPDVWQKKRQQLEREMANRSSPYLDKSKNAVLIGSLNETSPLKVTNSNLLEGTFRAASNPTDLRINHDLPMHEFSLSHLRDVYETTTPTAPGYYSIIAPESFKLDTSD